jgi:putative oxidoreductase
MKRFLFLPKLAALSDTALLLLRLLTGSFLIHGVWDNITSAQRMQEFVGFLTLNGFVAPSLMAPLSVYAQFFIGIALCLGLLTRWAGLLLAFNFTVGVIMVHLGQSFREIWPAAVLVVIGLLLAAQGAGRLSLDAYIERRGDK